MNNKFSRRILSVVLSVLMVISIFPLTTFALNPIMLNIGGAVYNPRTDTLPSGLSWDKENFALVMNNYTGTYIFAVEKPEEGLNIILKGTNTLSPGDNSGYITEDGYYSALGTENSGIRFLDADDKDAKLNIIMNDTIHSVRAIYSMGDISFRNNGTVDINVSTFGNGAKSEAIHADDVEITKNATVLIDIHDEQYIYAKTASIIGISADNITVSTSKYLSINLRSVGPGESKYTTAVPLITGTASYYIDGDSDSKTNTLYTLVNMDMPSNFDVYFSSDYNYYAYVNKKSTLPSVLSSHINSEFQYPILGTSPKSTSWITAKSCYFLSKWHYYNGADVDTFAVGTDYYNTISILPQPGYTLNDLSSGSFKSDMKFIEEVMSFNKAPVKIDGDYIATATLKFNKIKTDPPVFTSQPVGGVWYKDTTQFPVSFEAKNYTRIEWEYNIGGAVGPIDKSDSEYFSDTNTASLKIIKNICGSKFEHDDGNCLNSFAVISAMGYEPVTSNTVRVDFVDGVKLNITKQPEDVTDAKVGDKAVFSVVAEGNGLTYQWYTYFAANRSWRKITGSDTISGATTDKLSITFTDRTISSIVRCEITDSLGNKVTTDSAKVVKAAETPTEKPTETPTEKPTETPTEKPTETPTEKPTETPTEKPTETPTEKPTETPTEKPTETPTEKPTETPTEKPTEAPTENPTEAPTEKPTEPTTDKPIDFMKGDLNGDKKVTAADARIALRISAYLETATDIQFLAADVDENKKITASDARKILRVSASLDSF